MTYAASTRVTVERTKSEIMALLRKAGATRIGWSEDAGFHTGLDTYVRIAFEIDGRAVLMTMEADANVEEHLRTASGKLRDCSVAKRRHEQDIASRWRALFLVIKSNLTAVERGIMTFEQAFLAHVVLQDGRTVHDTMKAGELLAHRPKPTARELTNVV